MCLYARLCVDQLVFMLQKGNAEWYERMTGTFRSPRKVLHVMLHCYVLPGISAS